MKFETTRPSFGRIRGRSALNLGELCPAQATPWREQRDGFQKIGLSLAIFSDKGDQVVLRGKRELERLQIAEPGDLKALETNED